MQSKIKIKAIYCYQRHTKSATWVVRWSSKIIYISLVCNILSREPRLWLFLAAAFVFRLWPTEWRWICTSYGIFYINTSISYIMHKIKTQHRKQRNWFGWHFDCNILLRLLLSWQMRFHVVFSYDFFYFFAPKKFQGSTNIVADNCIVGLFSHCIVHLRIASLFGAVIIH